METDRILEPKKPLATYAIIGIITVIFLLLRLWPAAGGYISYLANQRYLVRLGEYHRLLTCAFVHYDIVHYLCNVYALYVIGSLAESYYGKWKYLIIFIFSAIAGSLLSISMSDAVSIGASGAIFGLLGSLLYFGYHYRVYFGSVLLQRIIPVIIINLAIGFMLPNIDNFAHIGGLVGGLLISKALGVNSKDKKSDKINGYILTAIYFGFLIFLGLFMR